MQIVNDPYFKLIELASTPLPQSVVYAGLHQCYYHDMVALEEKDISENRCGEIIVDKLLKGDFHGSPLEHASITFNFGYFPHSLISQLTRHRHISFSIQSFRYTGEYLNTVTIENVERYFYLRPVGFYTDRHGAKYEYSETHRAADIEFLMYAVHHYNISIKLGMPTEQARGLIPFDIRQHGIMTMNIRAVMQLLDHRYKANAQVEIQTLAQMVFLHFQEWVPEIAGWYEKSRLGRAKLAP